MSIESVRKRLEAATPGPWERYTNPAWDDPGYIRTPHTSDSRPRHVAYVRSDEGNPIPNAELIAHAPTDLRLALDVIESAKAVVSYEEVIAPTPGCDCPGCRLFAALDAFEAAP